MPNEAGTPEMMDDDRSIPRDEEFYHGRFVSIERELREDADSRRRFEIEPRAVLEEWSIHIPPGMELHVATNTDDTYHVIMPSDPNTTLADEDLTVSGGTARFRVEGNSGNASTVSCFPSCSATPLSD